VNLDEINTVTAADTAIRAASLRERNGHDAFKLADTRACEDRAVLEIEEAMRDQDDLRDRRAAIVAGEVDAERTIDELRAAVTELRARVEFLEGRRAVLRGMIADYREYLDETEAKRAASYLEAQDWKNRAVKAESAIEDHVCA
jgi:chromosome segregation ATPase